MFEKITSMTHFGRVQHHVMCFGDEQSYTADARVGSLVAADQPRPGGPWPHFPQTINTTQLVPL